LEAIGDPLMTDPATALAAALPHLDLAALHAQFQRDGFVRIPAVLGADELAAYAAAVDEAVTRRKVNDTRALADKTPYEQSFIQCQYLWEDFPAVRALTFDQKVTGLAAAMLGAGAVRIWHDQALYKEPGGRATEAHQDHAYWPIAELDALTAWIPLVDVDDALGCMGYAPGTQGGDCEFIDIFRTPGAGEAMAAKHADDVVWVPARAGDVLFHHARTVHMARPNRTERMRRVYTVIYFRDGCTRGSDRAHPSVDRDGIAEGRPIAGAATPIAWPRAGGGLPTPAPWPKSDSRSYRWSVEMGIVPATPSP
jgi:ectoine hydroxylase-related dioxygenase (phytanoyl-CoA dioxygenase family)